MSIQELEQEVRDALVSNEKVMVSHSPDDETGEAEVFVTVFVPEGMDVMSYTDSFQDHFSKLLYGIESKYGIDIPVFFTAA